MQEETIQLDPRIKELLLRRTGSPIGEGISEESAAGEIAVLARLIDPSASVPGLRVVARFGHVVTGRVALGRVIELRRHPNVASLKVSREYHPTLSASVPEIGASAAALSQAIPGGGPTGYGVVIGFCDWGADFAHANFRDERGTRILYLWDQRGGSHRDSPAPFGYGREFTGAQIDAALAQADPYAALGYDPADADIDGKGSHGTHVMDIAAGNGRAPGSSPGVAPGGKFIFVHLSGDDTRPEDTLGDSVRLAEAARYIVDRASSSPVVLNMSLGRTGGPHDASPLVVQGFDALLEERRGRMIVMSAGNYFTSGMHTHGRVPPGGRVDLRWLIVPRHDRFAEIEVWYGGADRFGMELVDPAGRVLSRVRLGEDSVHREAGQILASVYHRKRDPNNGWNVVNAFVWPNGPVGSWTVRLSGEAIVEGGGFHAWIEREDPRSQSRFASPTSIVSVGSVCNGRNTIAVAAYDPRADGRPIVSFSSSGPTRDDRSKPDISAPGAAIRAARSSRLEWGRRVMDETTVKSGTSMAAPHVTGTVALMFEAAGERRLSAHRTKNILESTSRTAPPSSASERLRYGAGRVDAAAAVREVAAANRSEDGPAELVSIGVVASEGVIGYQEAEAGPMVLGSVVAESGSPILQPPFDTPPESGSPNEGMEGFEGSVGQMIFSSPEHMLEEVGPPDEEEEFDADFAGWHEGSEPDVLGRLATILPERLVVVGDAELERTDDRGVPIYDPSQPLLFAPGNRRYTLSGGSPNYHAANFVYNTAFEVGYDVPVFPQSSENAARGHSYHRVSDAFDALARMDPYFDRFFEVIAKPGQLEEPIIRHGDLLLRRIDPESGAGSIAIVVDPVLQAVERFARSDSESGRALQCIGAGLRIERRADRVGRVIADDRGAILSDRMVIRFREGVIDVSGATDRLRRIPGYEWVSAKSGTVGGVAGTTELSGEVEDYRPRGGRVFTPSADAGAFRCAPTPVAVSVATEVPIPTPDPDLALRTAFLTVGAHTDAITTFERNRGFEGLRPMASRFGSAVMAELLGRLLYDPQRLMAPPSTLGSSQLQRLGVKHRVQLLAPRLLLTIPGHFRELARRAPNQQEAHALETVGWLLMSSVRDDIAAATRLRWWIPSPPPFVAPFANPLPALEQDVQRLIASSGLIDTTITFADYRAHFDAWSGGAAGRQWRREVGAESDAAGLGRPFYPAVVAIPPLKDVRPLRIQVDQAWGQRLADVDIQHQRLTQASTDELHRCANDQVPQGLFRDVSLHGVALVYDYPALEGARPFRALRVLGAIEPVLDRIFQSMVDLGWNDLLFQCAGASCFRGVKLPPDPAKANRHHQAARVLSAHGYGTALDFNTFENTQPATGSLDPRIVALFEAFGFRWGKCFPVPDPMHLEYCGTRC